MNPHVPVDLGNEYMGTHGIVPQTFFVEEYLPIDGTITVTKQVSIMDKGVMTPLEGSGLTCDMGLLCAGTLIVLCMHGVLRRCR